MKALKHCSIILAGLVLMAASSLSALAGDFAKREILGFSPNGGLFAFMEYGRQDGSGFPYANLYVIDTKTDQWVANSPYRVMLQDETREIYEAREEARIMAGPVLKSFEMRGEIVATNRAAELSGEPRRMAALPRTVVPPIDAPVEFRIDLEPVPVPELCEAFEGVTGFSLTQIGLQPGDQVRLLHKDESVPSSRNCPLDYSFADLVTYYPDGHPPVAAILIHMRTIGFEGPDGRFLAVTTQLQ